MTRAKFGGSLGDKYSDKQYGKSVVIPRKENPSTYLQASGALGKNGSPKMGDPAAPADLERPISVQEWIAQPYTEEQAITMHSMVTLYLAVREKLAFMSFLGSSIAKDLSLYTPVANAPSGKAFLETSLAAAKSLAQFDVPNNLSSLLNASTALETSILPRMGIEVRGYVPIFKNGVIDVSRVGNIGPSSRRIHNFGDLSETSIVNDLAALDLAGKTVKERYNLSAVLPLGVLLGIVLAFLAGVTILVGGIIDKFKPEVPPILNDPTVQEALRRMTPADAANFIKEMTQAQSFLGQIAGTLKWVAIAAGGLGFLGFIGWLMWKD